MRKPPGRKTEEEDECEDSEAKVVYMRGAMGRKALPLVG